MNRQFALKFRSARRTIARMAKAPDSNRNWFFYAAFAGVLYLCFRVVQPFLMPILFALILSTLLAPIFETIAKRLKGRRTLAALLVCSGLTVAILLPVLMLSVAVAREANAAYQLVKDPENVQRLSGWLDPETSPLLRRVEGWLPVLFNAGALDLTQLGTQAQQAGAAVLGAVATTATGVFGFVLDYFTMLIVLFFVLRDSSSLASAARNVSPLTEDQEHRFVEVFRTVSRVTVIGNLATSLSQGVLGGFVFLILGLSSPILWGALTALMSLVPVVGTAVIWIPWTIYLVATGSPGWAITFAILQIVLVGGIDNVLRPMLMERDMRLHTLLVFFSIVGGISYFGLAGLFLGPMVFAIAFAFLDLYKENVLA